MTFTIIIFAVTFFYWIYLIDGFKRRPLHRNYFKLYKDKKYLTVNLIASGLLALTSVPFSAMPFSFILLALTINKAYIHHYSKNFLFILRGDLVKGKFIDHFLSFVLLFGPLPMGLILSLIMRDITSGIINF